MTQHQDCASTISRNSRDNHDQNNWTQQLKENPPDPLEYIRQVHEEWLTELEGLALVAIATNNWEKFYSHVVDFQNEYELHGETASAIGEERVCLAVRQEREFQASAKSLSRSGADCLSQTEQQQTIKETKTNMTEPTKTFQITLESQPDIWQALPAPEPTTESPLPGWNVITDEFPELQYISNGADEETAKKLGDAFRAGQPMPQTGNQVFDRISSRLVQHSHYGKGGQ